MQCLVNSSVLKALIGNACYWDRPTLAEVHDSWKEVLHSAAEDQPVTSVFFDKTDGELRYYFLNERALHLPEIYKHLMCPDQKHGNHLDTMYISSLDLLEFDCYYENIGQKDYPLSSFPAQRPLNFKNLIVEQIDVDLDKLPSAVKRSFESIHFKDSDQSSGGSDKFLKDAFSSPSLKDIRLEETTVNGPIMESLAGRMESCDIETVSLDVYTSEDCDAHEDRLNNAVVTMLHTWTQQSHPTLKSLEIISHTSSYYLLSEISGIVKGETEMIVEHNFVEGLEARICLKEKYVRKWIKGMYTVFEVEIRDRRAFVGQDSADPDETLTISLSSW
uniref:F-box/LRR-repeat protein n=1 Tax=Steinernema glaseri TaxID=37863 RepID=A0A1I8AIU2_9BILA